jgi:N-acetylneuraminic acid mutarotase
MNHALESPNLGCGITCLIVAIVTLLGLPSSIGAPRELSFEDRVRAQEAIERVYYAHQIGATRPFEEAVPRLVLEKKVRNYLAQSMALDRLWRTPVTAEALWQETERMARQSRLPERLEDLYAALGRDPFLIQECLVRPALVDRLARRAFAFDPGIHRAERQEAEEVHSRLASGALGFRGDHPRRRVVEVVRVDDRTLPAVEVELPGPYVLGPETFERYRARLPARMGEVGPVVEEGDAFVTSVLLSEEATKLRVAEYRVPKTTWDAWWGKMQDEFAHDQVRAVADPSRPLPRPLHRASSPWTSEHFLGTAAACLPDDTWDNGILGGIIPIPEGRTQHTAVWSGSVMIIWGGEAPLGSSTYFSNEGARYDPATDAWTLTSTIGAPSARSSHTAVWTGRTMVVWGGTGYEGGHYVNLNTGGQYDPLTDSWTPTSTVNAPPAADRYGHAAVWTGARMVIWGGDRGGSPGTGGRYDPESDTWTATSLAGSPDGRYSPTAVWTGAEMIVWGGLRWTPSSSGTVNTGGRYDPVADIWRPTSLAGAPQARWDHTAVWTGSEMIVWGGRDGAYGGLNTGARYDPVTDTWRSSSTVGAPDWRAAHSAVWTGSRMIVWGGAYFVVDGELSTDTGGLYDPVTDTWKATTTVGAPFPRLRHTAVWTGSVMIVWGGFYGTDLTGRPQEITNTGGRYDSDTDRWTSTIVPPVRIVHSAVWTGSQMIIWGGAGYGDLGLGSRYDPATDTWSPATTVGAPSPRWGHAAVWTGSLMIIWGGYVGSVPSNTGGRYDPLADAWSPTSTAGAPSARSVREAVWTGDRMILWGGYTDPFPHFLNTGGIYDPVADSWSPTSTLDAPSARAGHRTVWTGSRMIIWGGSTGSAPFNTGGRYDPVMDAWQPVTTAGAPSARSGHTAVWTGSVMIVWGGSSTNTGGRYDPGADTWAPTSTLDAPSGRDGHSAVWTGNIMIVWGGYSGGVQVNTGGRFDPATDTWAPTSTLNAPLGRAYHTAVWTGGMMIVWGGEQGGGRYIFEQSVDNDLDGHSECAGDCNDADPAIHPGAAETCNGHDDDCDGVIDTGGDALCNDGDSCTADFCAGPSGCQHPLRDGDMDGHPDSLCGGDDCNDIDSLIWLAPEEVTNLRVSTNSPADLAWDDQGPLVGPGTTYDLVSGHLMNGAGIDFPGAICLQSSGGSTYSDVRPDPDVGTAHWYLARGRNSCGVGTYGTSQRDTSIPPCP